MSTELRMCHSPCEQMQRRERPTLPRAIEWGLKEKKQRSETEADNVPSKRKLDLIISD